MHARGERRLSAKVKEGGGQPGKKFGQKAMGASPRKLRF